VDDALVILNHTPKKAAGMISKVIANAKASAMRNHNFQEHGLQITEITISPGPTMKRFRPQAFGRAAPYRRRTSHVRVILDGNVKVTKKTVAKSSKKPLSAVKTVTKKETK
jgi:large subunit ribosomal protein L22